MYVFIATHRPISSCYPLTPWNPSKRLTPVASCHLSHPTLLLKLVSSVSSVFWVSEVSHLYPIFHPLSRPPISQARQFFWPSREFSLDRRSVRLLNYLPVPPQPGPSLPSPYCQMKKAMKYILSIKICNLWTNDIVHSWFWTVLLGSSFWTNHCEKRFLWGCRPIPGPHNSNS